MPISSKEGKGIIKNWFKKQTDIKTIVDLGPGSGTYPKLLGKNKYIWKAVEIWGPYIKRWNLNKLYQEVRIGDIQYTEIPNGDCVIFGDILEHLKKKAAIKTFKKIDKQFKHVVISIPIESHSQYVFEGNKFERHISAWTKEELEKLIPPTYKIRNYSKSSPQSHTIAVFIK